MARNAKESMKPRGISRGSMLNEDMSKPGNLPENVVRKQYENIDYPYMQRDDSIKWMDGTAREDMNEMKRQPSKRK
jgi:hypothetical protein